MFVEVFSYVGTTKRENLFILGELDDRNSVKDSQVQSGSRRIRRITVQTVNDIVGDELD